MTLSGSPWEFGGVTPALLWHGERLRNSFWWTCLQNIKIHTLPVVKFSTIVFNLSLCMFSLIFSFFFLPFYFFKHFCYTSSLQQTLQGFFGMYLVSSLHLFFLSNTAKLGSCHIKSCTSAAVGKFMWYRSTLQFYLVFFQNNEINPILV